MVGNSKKEKHLSALQIILIISIVIILVLSYLLFSNNSQKSIDITPGENSLNSQNYLPIDCKVIAEEAETKMNSCIMQTLRNIYGIEYESSTPSRESCFYTLSDGYCLNENTKNYYLNLSKQTCEKSFPTKADSYSQCLAKTG